MRPMYVCRPSCLDVPVVACANVQGWWLPAPCRLRERDDWSVTQPTPRDKMTIGGCVTLCATAPQASGCTRGTRTRSSSQAGSARTRSSCWSCSCSCSCSSLVLLLLLLLPLLLLLLLLPRSPAPAPAPAPAPSAAPSAAPTNHIQLATWACPFAAVRHLFPSFHCALVFPCTRCSTRLTHPVAG